MVLVSTQPLTEISTRDLSWDTGLTNFATFMSQMSEISRSLKHLAPSGPSKVCPGIALT